MNDPTNNRPGRHRRPRSRLLPAVASAAVVVTVAAGVLIAQAATGPASTAAETATRAATTAAEPVVASPETTTAAAATTAGTYEPSTPEFRRYLAVLDERGLDLSRDEQWVAVELATAQCLTGGFVAGRQGEIRGEVQAALPRLDGGQDEVVVDCVVKVCGMLAAARGPE